MVLYCYVIVQYCAVYIQTKISLTLDVFTCVMCTYGSIQVIFSWNSLSDELEESIITLPWRDQYQLIINQQTALCK